MASACYLKPTKIRRFIFLLSIVAGLQAYAQSTTSDYLIATDGVFLYTASDGNIIKTDQKGDEIIRYSSQMLDEFSILDCTQPLKIMAFSEFSQEYVFLDQFMVETGGKRLIDLGVRYASAVTTAKDGNIWVLDQIGMTLQKLDPLREIELIKIPLEKILPGNSRVAGLIEFQNRLYIHERSLGILMFDLYGNSLGKLADSPVEYFMMNKKGVYLSRPKGIYFIAHDTVAEVMVSTFNPGPFSIIGSTLFYKRDGVLQRMVLD